VEFTVGFTPDRCDNSKFVGPNISRSASRVSLASLNGTGSDDDDDDSGQQHGGGTSGSVEEQP
jgi:hypothetical protein